MKKYIILAILPIMFATIQSTDNSNQSQAINTINQVLSKELQAAQATMNNNTKPEVYSTLHALALYANKNPQNKEIAIASMKAIKSSLENLKTQENKKLSYYSWLFNSNILIQEINRAIKETDKNITALGAWLHNPSYYAKVGAISYVSLIASLYTFAYIAESLNSKKPTPQETAISPQEEAQNPAYQDFSTQHTQAVREAVISPQPEAQSPAYQDFLTKFQLAYTLAGIEEAADAYRALSDTQKKLLDTSPQIDRSRLFIIKNQQPSTAARDIARSKIALDAIERKIPVQRAEKPSDEIPLRPRSESNHSIPSTASADSDGYTSDSDGSTSSGISTGPITTRTTMSARDAARIPLPPEYDTDTEEDDFNAIKTVPKEIEFLVNHFKTLNRAQKTNFKNSLKNIHTYNDIELSYLLLPEYLFGDLQNLCKSLGWNQTVDKNNYKKIFSILKLTHEYFST